MAKKTPKTPTSVVESAKAEEALPTVATPGPEASGASDDAELDEDDEEEPTAEELEAKLREDLSDILSNEDTVQAVIEFLEEEDMTLDDVKVEEGYWGYSESSDFATVTCGHKEWGVAPSEDDAEKFAVERVRQDLEQDPENFNQDWLQHYVDEDKLRDALMSDVEESIRESPESYGFDPDEVAEDMNLAEVLGDSDLTVPGTLGNILDQDVIEELVSEHSDNLETENLILEVLKTRSLVIKPGADSDEITIEVHGNVGQDHGCLDDFLEYANGALVERAQDLAVEQAKENGPADDWITEKAEEILKDPVDYLADIYGKDGALKEAIRIAGIDEQEAAEDAVSADGIGHFLAGYDGDLRDLSSGGVYWRHN